MKKASDALKSPISDASKYKQSDYTPETWAALQEALKQANALLNKEDVTEDEVNRAKQALENAIRGLKEKEVAVTTTSLTSAIQNAAAYTDTTKYQSAYVQALNSRINAANALLTSSGVTQAEINQAVQDIQAAIEACKAHPVIIPIIMLIRIKMITPIKVILRVELAIKKMAGQLAIHLVISILHRRDSLLEESLLLSSIN